MRAFLIWAVLLGTVAAAVFVAAQSPYLQYRQPVYVAAGFAGVAAMAILLFQPLLAAGLLPGLSGYTGRRVHRWTGAAMVVALVIHVGGLWITSPPDVIDALTFTSPTPFSAWGVVGMWAIFAAALMAALRPRWRLHPQSWRLGHSALAIVVVLAGVVHAILIEGTMGRVSKAFLCALVVVALASALRSRKVWAALKLWS